MALLTSTGDYNLPYESGPSRATYQAYTTLQTITTSNLLSTITSTKSFVITKIGVTVYDATASAVVIIKANNEEVARFNGATVGTYFNDYGPIGAKAAAADTATCQLQISGGTCGAAVYVQGYFD